ncbi:pentatricopeptide repeat-containing protein At5g02830, chloroplastic [Typha latifolia]|uniref:pentatricopeptide repeat-containing protein At5g02830, chloroplastic n=1 Tax=Typha latifolia TaxID=4733 RepID=UPI003C2E2DEF
MAESTLILSSSSSSSSSSSPLLHPNRSASSLPRRRRHLRPPPKPLLSDVRRDLASSSNPASSSDLSTRRLLKYYARLASKLAGSGRLREFLMLAESVLTSEAVANESPQFAARLSPRLISEGIASVLRRGNLEAVLDFVKDAERLGICTPALFDESAMGALAVECRRLVDQERLEEFVGLMETLAGYRFFIKDIVDPVYVVKKFVKKHDPDMAVRYVSIFPHSQLLFCSILEEFAKKHDVTSAVRAFEAFKQQSGGINMFACRSIIDICGLCGDFLQSRIIFEDLLAQKISPNVYVVNSLMNANAHDLSYTLHVYKNMQNLGLTADRTSYNILLKACCNAKRVDLAQDIYEEMKYMALKGELKLDVYTYSTMIKVFADAKMWQMAFSIREEMISSGVTPNIVTWSSLISACANAGLVDHAIQVFEDMLIAGCEPNAQCCNIILDACIESCQYDKAFRLFYDWKDTGFKIYHTSKGGSYDRGNFSSSLKYATENDRCELTCTVVPFKPTIATFNILMKACGTDFYRAKALMDEMKIVGLTPNHISWSVLIDIYGTAQNIQGAMQAFRKMREVGIKLDVVAYTTAIKACVENKNSKMAFSLFEEMKRHMLQPNSVTYNTLLRARSRYGSLREIQQCLAVYQEMRKAGYCSNDHYLKELIEEWCEGVLSSKSQNRSVATFSSFSTKTPTRKPYNLFLEKVARRLQKDVGDNQIIDIRGLTKVEARIIVLSVLRMIKESYLLGKTIQEDMIIITGMGKPARDAAATYVAEVQHSVIKVLKDELGLNIMAGHGALSSNNAPTQPDDVLSTSEVLDISEDYTRLARRPQDLGVLKVSRDSLYHWLQKKVL